MRMHNAQQQALKEIGPAPVEMPNFWRHITERSRTETVRKAEARFEEWKKSPDGKLWLEWDKRMAARINELI